MLRDERGRECGIGGVQSVGRGLELQVIADQLRQLGGIRVTLGAVVVDLVEERDGCLWLYSDVIERAKAMLPELEGGVVMTQDRFRSAEGQAWWAYTMAALGQATTYEQSGAKGEAASRYVFKRMWSCGR